MKNSFEILTFYLYYKIILLKEPTLIYSCNIAKYYDMMFTISMPDQKVILHHLFIEPLFMRQFVDILHL